MAITFVAASKVNYAAGASASCPKPTGTAQNDVLYALVYADNNPTITPTDSWTLIDSENQTNGPYVQKTYYRVAGNSEPSSYAFSTSSSGIAVHIMAFRGCDTSSPLDSTHRTAQANGSSPSATTFTPSVNGCVVIVGAINYGGAAQTPPTGYTEGTDQDGLEDSYLIQTTATATGALSTSGGSGAQTIQACAFKPPSSGSSVSGAATIALKASGLTKSGAASIALKATGLTRSGAASIALLQAGLTTAAAATIALKAADLTKSGGATFALKALGNTTPGAAAIALQSLGNTKAGAASIALLAAGLTKPGAATVALKAADLTRSAAATIALSGGAAQRSAAATIALKAVGLTQAGSASIALKATNLTVAGGASLALKATGLTKSAAATIALATSALSKSAAATIALKAAGLTKSGAASVALKAVNNSATASATIALLAQGTILGPIFARFATLVRFSSAFAAITRLGATYSAITRLSAQFSRSLSVVQPYSTTDSTATLTLPGGVSISAVTCVVTFPDGTTTSLSLGSGIVMVDATHYKATYTTKSPGQNYELWTFTGSDSSVAQFRNAVGAEY